MSKELNPFSSPESKQEAQQPAQEQKETSLEKAVQELNAEMQTAETEIDAAAKEGAPTEEVEGLKTALKNVAGEMERGMQAGKVEGKSEKAPKKNTETGKWMQRLGFLGALAAGHAGLYAGANKLGESSAEKIEQIAQQGTSLGISREEPPARVNTESGTEAPPTQEPEAAEEAPAEEMSPQVPEQPPMSEAQYQREVADQSAELVAEQMVAEGTLDHMANVTELGAETERRLREAGVGEADIARTVESVRVRMRDAVNASIQERAQHNVEEAIRMAGNGFMATVDTHELAIAHHRPDLAARMVADSVSGYEREHGRANTDEDLPNRLESERRDLLRVTERSGFNDVASKLDRHSRETLRQAIDEQLAYLQATPEVSNADQERNRLEAARRELL